MLIRACKRDFRWRRDLTGDMRRYWYENIMRIPQVHFEPLSIAAIRCSSRILFQRSSVSDSDQVQGHFESLGHSNDSIENKRARRAPHLSLYFDFWILDGYFHDGFFGKFYANEWMKRDWGGTKGTNDGESGGWRIKGNIKRKHYGFTTNMRDMLLSYCWGAKAPQNRARAQSRSKDHEMKGKGKHWNPSVPGRSTFLDFVPNIVSFSLHIFWQSCLSVRHMHLSLALQA